MGIKIKQAAIDSRDTEIAQINEYFCTKLADDVLWPLAQQMNSLGEMQD